MCGKGIEGVMGIMGQRSLRLGLLLCILCLMDASHCAPFDELFEASWAVDHVVREGELLKLKLDNVSGAGFASKSTYLFGKASVQIKLVPGDSAGTVTAFYMSSQGAQHDEFDFEFLGNSSGQPYIVQTNIYSNGTGNREQRIYLWFDPSQAFHTYSFLWNRNLVVFLVDDVPIRVFPNKEKSGVPFPQRQAMGVFSSIWNADDWATQGGLVKTNWTNAPFVSTYSNFDINACEYRGVADSCTNGGDKWWDGPSYTSLTALGRRNLRWVQKNYMIYDYCRDSTRFPSLPAECGGLV